MEINRTIPGLSTSPIPSTSRPMVLAVSATANAQLQQWKTGQSLEALIVQINNTQARLKLDGINLTISDPLVTKMHAGQILNVKVEQALPTPKLTVLIPNAEKTNLLDQTIRQKLPQQQELPLTLNKLSEILRKTDTIPAITRNQLQQSQSAILKSIPNVSNNLALDLKQYINNAAVFSHNLIQQHLVHNRNFPDNNTQIQLFRLSGLIRSILSNHTIPLNSKNTDSPSQPASTYDAQGKLPIPQSTSNSVNASASHSNAPPSKPLPIVSNQYMLLDELLKATDGAIAKTQTQQLQMLRSEEPSNPLWLFEIPLKQGKGTDVFEFLIRRDSDPSQNEYQKTWQVQLTFNLQGLGEVLANIKLRDNNTIDVNFIAETNQTTSLFNKHLDTLLSKFENNGIFPGNLSCEHDVISRHKENPVTKQSLVKEKT